jgi:serine/threonine-protein kinase
VRDTATLFKPPEGTRASSLSLPPDLLAKSRRRVRLVAILALIGFGSDVVVFSGAFLISRITGNQWDGPPESYWLLWGNIAAIVAALALIAGTRSPRFRDETILTLARIFQVILCVIISVANPWGRYIDTGHLPALTWVSPLIIMFPLIVPGRPSRIVVTSLLAAATSPLGLWLLETTGRVEATPDDYISNLFSPLIATLFAYLASRTVYELGLDVTRARQIGAYRLEERLGQGGMGEVWRARHRMLARPAAVKLIRPDLLGAGGIQGPEAMERFEREAQATALMQSPHTIALYDYGVSSEGTFYYVMELLDGFDTETLVARFGPLEAARVVPLLRQVCDSLAEAHERGLIHRDIKPANIYLCRYGRRFDFVKVLDFGLVKSRNDLGAADPKLTAGNMAAGTPATMSPEQILGKPVDGRADLYGVGCLGYWLLTGRLVFEGNTPLEIIGHHAHTTPAPPSTRTELPVPPQLDAVILACLRKDPADRPQTADELEAALAAIPLANPWTPERARRWWESHHPADQSRAITTTE